MIVVDNDVISYFWLEATRTAAARGVRQRDADWVAPRLWQSEFRNVMHQHMRHRDLLLEDALRIVRDAEEDLANRTLDVQSERVLQLVDASNHSAYDCEYVALAQRLGVPLVTGDKRLARVFPETAVLLEAYAEGR